MVVLYAINSLLFVDTKQTCVNSGELQNQRLEKCVEDGEVCLVPCWVIRETQDLF